MSKKTRSRIMSSIRSKWTLPEVVLHRLLMALEVDHRMHPKLPGNPDILVRGTRTAIFVNGCFWHGCERHFRAPKTNRAFWKVKIARNRAKQADSARRLRQLGFRVLVFWEHDMKKGRER